MHPQSSRGEEAGWAGVCLPLLTAAHRDYSSRRAPRHNASPAFGLALRCVPGAVVPVPAASSLSSASLTGAGHH